MENPQGSRSRSRKIKVPPGMKTTKLVIGGGRNQSICLSPTSFDSENVDPNSPVLRYLCGGSPISGKLMPRGLRSPLSAMENLIERSPPTVYRTPVKAVEGEEVLVMDGVPLRRSSRFSGSESSGSSGKSPFKAEIFLSPEDSGKRGFTSKGQYARGQEDYRPTRLGIKNRANHQFITRSPNALFFPRPTTPPDTLFFPRPTTPPDTLFFPRPTTPPDETMPIPNNYPPISSNNDLARLNMERLKARTRQPTPPPPPVPVPAQVVPTPNDAPATQKFPVSYKNALINKSPSDCLPQDDGIEVSLPDRSSGKPPPKEGDCSPQADGIDVSLPGRSSGKPPLKEGDCSPQHNGIEVSLPGRSSGKPPLKEGDWSPQDDGIEVSLPGCSSGKPSSREEVNKAIEKALAGTKGKKRLPEFSNICPE